MKLSGVFAIVVLATHATLSAGEATAARHEARDQAIRDFFQAQDADSWFQTHQFYVNTEFASHCQTAADASIEESQFKVARLLYSLSSLVYLKTGDRERALGAAIGSVKAMHYRAETGEEYLEARNFARTLMEKARSIQRRDLEFKAALTAADAGYFGEIAGKEPTIGQFNDLASDLLAALRNMPSAKPIEFEQLTSLLTASLEKMLWETALYRHDSEAKTHLEELATLSERCIPPDFTYTNSEVGNFPKAILAARVFAYLSRCSGDPKHARARLLEASRRTREYGEIESWLPVAIELHDVNVALGVPDQEKETIRNELRSGGETFRAAMSSRAGRIWASYRLEDAYGKMLDDMLRSATTSSNEAIFRAIEFSKARSLHDSLRSKFKELSDSNSLSEARKLEQTAIGFNPDDDAGKDMAVDELRLVSQLTGFADFESGERPISLHRLEQLYKTNKAGFSASQDVPTLKEIQSHLTDEAIVEYVIPYHPLHPARTLWIMVITRDTFHVVESPFESSALGFTGRFRVGGKAPVASGGLGDGIVELRTAIRNADDQKALRKLKTFGRVLIGPIQSHLSNLNSIRQIVFVPHGPLHYLPFHALTDRNDKFLIQSYCISVAPSAAVWLTLQSRQSRASNFVAMADTSLGFSSAEIESVQAFLPSRRHQLFSTNAADVFSTAAQTAGILHVAAHGDFPSDRALNDHSIALPGFSGQRFISASDIRAMNLSQLHLAFLSVCNGGLYRIGPADEPYGLVPAFLEAGSENVLATLWPLDDEFAKDFASEFYKCLPSASPADAFRAACQKFIAEDEFLRRWAGFLLIGPGKP